MRRAFRLIGLAVMLTLGFGTAAMTQETGIEEETDIEEVQTVDDDDGDDYEGAVGLLGLLGLAGLLGLKRRDPDLPPRARTDVNR
ncbi:hypothetical protein BH18GEM1_BH18GEM1_18700 [soil metagenome]